MAERHTQRGTEHGEDLGKDRGKNCPICGKARHPDYAPFCSARCADVDLHRWLSGTYAIPTDEPVDTDDAESGRPDPT